ncbi:hypothetical protein HanRHA438_Chr15g0718541 [Helianthus annuus]|uniref:Uncharacterized protein n=1 Tax=Helianthus annuus TaxID=4232 RepID=A0A251SBG4_HELAN|nr:hypothetical protein HanXRQr2_Chr15g0706321 [Helianthus annuus]KAJ0452150.1 hypothetical protein HanHA300_Chr15g0575681 [Helianthus annuus]KAJ0474056.1 hypothetical protein HanHA89_Chr15g0625401 [Helianthus annuus]KAJ0649620.1 hypothetical protein HanLR1_Chr15g0586391 [Helianthus annuus]KAJ0653410.1 hypothetical protein HanOQP8_Chr15g0583261 [Helianthus annuus]
MVFLPSPLSRDSRPLVSPPHKTPSMFNHNSKSRETLDSVNHRPCPLRLFEPSPTAIAPPSATKPESLLPVLLTLICLLLII